jgi:hypothetical protein
MDQRAVSQGTSLSKSQEKRRGEERRGEERREEKRRGEERRAGLRAASCPGLPLMRGEKKTDAGNKRQA